MADFTRDEVFAEIDKQATAAGLDPRIVKALTVAENTGSGSTGPKAANIYSGAATNSNGTMGVMQVIPSTAEGLKKNGYLRKDWAFNPTDLAGQVEAGIATIREMQSRMQNPNDIFELGSYYNGGNAGWKKYLAGNANSMSSETRDYLVKLQTAGRELGMNIGHKMTPQQIEAAATGGQSGSFPGGNSGRGSSTSVSTTQKVGDPELQAQFRNLANSYIAPGGVADQTAAAISGSGAEIQSGLEGVISAAMGQAVAKGVQATARAATLAAGAARRDGILRDMNLHPDVAENQASQAVSGINRLQEEMTPLEAEINSRMAVSIFDNPIQWFINQTRLPGMVNAFNGMVRQQNRLSDVVKTNQAIASNQQALSSGIEADEILNQGVADANAAAADAQATAAAARLQVAGSEARTAMSLAGLAKDKVGVAQALARDSQETQTIRESENERAGVARRMQMEIDDINRNRQAAGLDPITPEQYKLLDAKTRTTEVARASKNSFGSSFAESFPYVDIDTMARKGGAATAIWYKQTAGTARHRAEQEAAKAENKLNPKFKIEEEFNKQLNNLQQVYQGEAESNMRTASASNPMKLDYVSIAKTPEMQNNPLAIFINQFGPQAEKPVFTTIDEKYIMDRFVASVEKGSMTAPAAAKAISDFYKFGTQKQAIATAYPLFGLKAPTKTYAITLPEWQISKTIDLGNPQQVENALTLKVAQDIAKNRSSILYGRGSTLMQDARQEQQQQLEQARTRMTQSQQRP